MSCLNVCGFDYIPYSPEGISNGSFDSDCDILNIFKRCVLGIVLGIVFCAFFYMPTMESCEKTFQNIHLFEYNYDCNIWSHWFLSGFYLSEELYR
jgi:hypothetical protein